MDAVIGKERYATGKVWDEYLSSGIRNQAHFEENYQLTKLPADRVRKLQDFRERPDGPRRIAVIGEDWCPDVYRGFGVAQRMAETMDIECRLFERDQNKDLIRSFLFKGEFASIPVFIFLDEHFSEIAHFIERPQIAHEQLHVVHDTIGDISPAAIGKRLGRDASDDDVKRARAEARQRYVEWQRGKMCAAWRIATVDECISSLEEASEAARRVPGS